VSVCFLSGSLCGLLLAALCGPLCGGPLLCGPVVWVAPPPSKGRFPFFILSATFILCMSSTASAAVLSHTRLKSPPPSFPLFLAARVGRNRRICRRFGRLQDQSRLQRGHWGHTHTLPELHQLYTCTHTRFIHSDHTSTHAMRADPRVWGLARAGLKVLCAPK